ncbi:MAG: hypothetical protein ACE360_17375 [Hyphomicrobiales bacterium]
MAFAILPAIENCKSVCERPALPSGQQRLFLGARKPTHTANRVVIDITILDPPSQNRTQEPQCSRQCALAIFHDSAPPRAQFFVSCRLAGDNTDLESLNVRARDLVDLAMTQKGLGMRVNARAISGQCAGFLWRPAVSKHQTFFSYFHVEIT